ncbi:hypothetical protein S83_048595, partial [Arachis hypogaea]
MPTDHALFYARWLDWSSICYSLRKFPFSSDILRQNRSAINNVKLDSMEQVFVLQPPLQGQNGRDLAWVKASEAI